MNDPRAKVFTALEGIEEGGAELKDSLKTWIDNEVQLKVDANTARDTAVTERDEQKGLLDTLNTDFETFKTEAETVAGQKTEPSAELTEMKTQYAAMEKRLNDADEKTAKAEAAKFMGDVKSTFLKGVNLKDDFAESKIDLAIAMGNVQKAEDGTTQIVVGENKFTIETYGKHLEESHSSQLKTVTGGKQGNFTTEPAGDVDQTAKVQAEVKAGTNGLVQFRN